MNSVLDLVGILAELFTWVGLILGVLCLLVVMILRLTRLSWIETDAVIVEESGSAQLRWMTTEGTLHTRILDDGERSEIDDPDELHVHYHRHAPDRIKFEATGHGEKVLRALGLILLGIGIAAIIVSLVVLFIER